MIKLLSDSVLSTVTITAAGVLILCLLYDVFFMFGLKSQPSPVMAAVRQLNRLRKGWPYMLRGPELILEGYKKTNGNAFIIQAPSAKHLMLSSPTHVRELDVLSSKHLSLHAAAKEILQPRYTYTDHQWEWSEIRGAESTGFNRAVRSLMTNNLAKIAPSLHRALTEELEARIATCKTKDGWIKLSVTPVVKWTYTVVNSVLFFGEDFAKSEDIRVAMANYQEIVPLCAELAKVLPAFITPFVCRLLTGNYRSYRKMHGRLIAEAEQRVQERATREKGTGDSTDRPLDGVQWLLDTSPKPTSKSAWDATRTIDEAISTWYTSVPQLSAITSFAVHDLALYPQWQEKLLNELRGSGYDEFLQTGYGLPLMEAFIKESTRLNPIDGVVCRRKVISGPVEFSSGLRVQEGDWVSVPQQAMWRDGRLYENPDEFDPMRFLKPNAKSNTVGLNDYDNIPDKPELTEVSPKWVIWGFGRTACPGRFIATFEIKLFLSHLLLNYHMKTVEAKKQQFSWTSAIVPSDSTEVLLKKL